MDDLVLTDTRLGAAVVTCNDEFFGAAANLLRAEAPTRRPGVYTDHGAWVDGWETRRRREPGEDWCVVKLGVPGLVRRVTVDTTHFSGNQPESFRVEGCGDATPDADATWFEVHGRTALQPDDVCEVDVDCDRRVTFLRLVISPDGGVARFRASGAAVPSPQDLAAGGAGGGGVGGSTVGGGVELASATLGAVVEECSDAHFSTPSHLLLPGAPVSMGDGWETRRRRGPGHDWVVVRLATRGVPRDVEVDTTFFKGNAPATCALEGRDGTGGRWHALLAETPLRAHAPQWFRVDTDVPVTHVRLTIAPDGGVARLRVRGSVPPDGAEAVGMRWLDTLPEPVAARALRQVCASRRWAAETAARRPFGSLDALRAAAVQVWDGLTPADWREAFAAHPRIGAPGASSRAAREQAAAAGAPAEVAAALAEGNRAYEERFGHVFLVRAAGRTAEEMLTMLHERLAHDPDTELRVAAAQQAEITDLRLRQLVGA